MSRQMDFTALPQYTDKQVEILTTKVSNPPTSQALNRRKAASFKGSSTTLNEEFLQMLRGLGNEDDYRHVEKYLETLSTLNDDIPNTTEDSFYTVVSMNEEPIRNNEVFNTTPNTTKQTRRSIRRRSEIRAMSESKVFSTIPRPISATTSRARSVPPFLRKSGLNQQMSLKDISKVLDKRQKQRQRDLDVMNKKLEATSQRVRTINM